jgi:hypothetical protein
VLFRKFQNPGGAPPSSNRHLVATGKAKNIETPESLDGPASSRALLCRIKIKKQITQTISDQGGGTF